MDVPSPPQIMVDRAGAPEIAECGEDVDLSTDDHLMNLKALAEKLRLETRRPSYLEWKARLEAERESGTVKGAIQAETGGKVVAPKDTAVNSDAIQCRLQSNALKRFGNVDEALSWLRRELVRFSCRVVLDPLGKKEYSWTLEIKIHIILLFEEPLCHNLAN